MASSHAGTRLPIAVSSRRRALPLRLPRLSADTVFTSFLKEDFIKKQETPDAASPKKSIYDFLRRHYPHQVKGRSVNFLSACSMHAPLFFITNILSVKVSLVKYSSIIRYCPGNCGSELLGMHLYNDFVKHIFFCKSNSQSSCFLQFLLYIYCLEVCKNFRNFRGQQML